MCLNWSVASYNELLRTMEAGVSSFRLQPSTFAKLTGIYGISRTGRVNSRLPAPQLGPSFLSDARFER